MEARASFVLLVAMATVALAAHHPATPTPTAVPKTTEQIVADLANVVSTMATTVNSLKDNLESLTRQVMLQQLYVEERTRSDGDTGLKQVRIHTDGTLPYFSESITNGGIASIHEHANNDRTVGMGELNMVMNGVDFRTRHNDYRLRMPSRNKGDYNVLNNIAMPPVPPEVLAKPTLQEQITEMRLWFKAFNEQDHSVRDYRKYFKPVLTYMEAGWTTNTKTLTEPFFSDRHHIDASSWFDLQDKVRFTSYSGGKNSLENFAYLPTTIINVKNGTAEYAQWNYRIACHPLEQDLPLSTFELIDDLSSRMRNKMKIDKYSASRMARFNLKPKIMNAYQLRKYHDAGYKWGLLDDIMYQIPGKDNYDAVIYDSAFGDTAYHIHGNFTKLNTARYHRWYKIDTKDAMGIKTIHRGFADSTLFVAQTTQPGIAPMTVTNCKKEHRPGFKHGHLHTVCTEYTERFTYAVPLEVVFLTPLYNWNPYNFTNRAEQRDATFGGRNGGMTPDKAYNGTHSKLHYWTPTEFFSSGEVHRDRADTARGAVGVIDPSGTVRKVVASGTRIILPKIDGVGNVRTRYPIMPLHAEGQQTRKELEALKSMVLHMPTYSSLFEELPTSVAKANALHDMEEHVLKVAPTQLGASGLHDHDIVIHGSDLDSLKAGHVLRGIFTSISNGHQHSVDVQMVNGEYMMVKCDGMDHCFDGHDMHLVLDH